MVEPPYSKTWVYLVLLIRNRKIRKIDGKMEISIDVGNDL
jgi:hypothetical protein